MNDLPRAIVVGDLIQDLLVELREPLAPGDDARATIHTSAGGSVANVAANLARLGVRAYLVCRVGADLPGRELVEELEHDGVELHATEDPSRPTGKVVVLVDPDGERTMLTDRGANLSLCPDDLPGDLFRPGDHLHLSGYSFFEPAPRDAAIEALRRACETGMTLSVDPSSASLLGSVGAERFLEWTGGADLCLPNLDEGTALSGEQRPEEIVRALGEHYSGVALKLGSGGAVYASRRRETIHSPAEPARVADTTGAGDAFCAGFLAAWLASEPPEEALRRANRLAAHTVGAVGARRTVDQR